MDEISVLDYGYVRLVGSLGNDLTPVYAARISFDSNAYQEQERNIKLLKYLLSNGHLTPFEHVVLSLEIKCPIFVARQIMRHRTFSYNEVSQRYTDVSSDEFYLPYIFRKQSKSNKQASEDGFYDDKLVEEIYAHYKLSNYLYKKLLGLGIAREQARIVLPVAVYTRFIMTGNLRNWFNFLKERLSVDAQYETKEYAVAIREIIRRVVPTCYDLWEELNLKENKKYLYLFEED